MLVQSPQNIFYCGANQMHCGTPNQNFRWAIPAHAAAPPCMNQQMQTSLHYSQSQHSAACHLLPQWSRGRRGLEIASAMVHMGFGLSWPRTWVQMTFLWLVPARRYASASLCESNVYVRPSHAGNCVKAKILISSLGVKQVKSAVFTA